MKGTEDDTPERSKLIETSYLYFPRVLRCERLDSFRS